eukprot:TRINITY_DN12845_c0_g1_i1.p3 TRINITY_DN12845_c0_g1~~TRINITY_DN12845_c0_g1_i1.p3  ORF type:complete len:257 (-),score=4.10 TRINITY_DN12845_c0_g1_i1:61-831(-)
MLDVLLADLDKPGGVRGGPPAGGGGPPLLSAGRLRHDGVWWVAAGGHWPRGRAWSAVVCPREGDGGVLGGRLFAVQALRLGVLGAFADRLACAWRVPTRVCRMRLCLGGAGLGGAPPLRPPRRSDGRPSTRRRRRPTAPSSRPTRPYGRTAASVVPTSVRRRRPAPGRPPVRPPGRRPSAGAVPVPTVDDVSVTERPVAPSVPPVPPSGRPTFRKTTVRGPDRRRLSRPDGPVRVPAGPTEPPDDPSPPVPRPVPS